MVLEATGPLSKPTQRKHPRRNELRETTEPRSQAAIDPHQVHRGDHRLALRSEARLTRARTISRKLIRRPWAELRR